MSASPVSVIKQPGLKQCPEKHRSCLFTNLTVCSLLYISDQNLLAPLFLSQEEHQSRRRCWRLRQVEDERFVKEPFRGHG